MENANGVTKNKKEIGAKRLTIIPDKLRTPDPRYPTNHPAELTHGPEIANTAIRSAIQKGSRERRGRNPDSTNLIVPVLETGRLMENEFQIHGLG